MKKYEKYNTQHEVKLIIQNKDRLQLERENIHMKAENEVKR